MCSSGKTLLEIQQGFMGATAKLGVGTVVSMAGQPGLASKV